MNWIFHGADLKSVLQGVSRSFYLSLVLLPKRIRFPMGLAFLCCKAADTIADTELLPKNERLHLLDAYRELFSNPANGFAHDIAAAVVKPQGGSFSERALIRNLPALMEALETLPQKEWLLIRELVLELTQGMQMDLNFFPGETKTSLKAFVTLKDLDQYIYYVAGCVGRFWTRMIKTHFPFSTNFGKDSEHIGENLGKGLQLVNILRDVPRDLRRGRCYIPEEILAKAGLKPEDLLSPRNLSQAGVVFNELAGLAKGYLGQTEKYVACFPWFTLRLKALIRLPMRLGMQTLRLLEISTEWLDPGITLKVSRRQVYATLLGGLLR